jgi:hypothetical protein
MTISVAPAALPTWAFWVCSTSTKPVQGGVVSPFFCLSGCYGYLKRVVFSVVILSVGTQDIAPDRTGEAS